VNALLLIALACTDYELQPEPVGGGYSLPAIEVSPSEMQFGDLTLGETETQTLTVTNVGDNTLEVMAIHIEESAAFTLLNPSFPIRLEEDEQTTLDVIYTPDGFDHEGGALVLSDDPDRPQISVPMTGGWAAPELMITPTELDFSWYLIECSTTGWFELTNVGDDVLQIYSVGTEESWFQVVDSPDLSKGLPPGESVWVEVAFKPTDTQSYTGTFWAASNDPFGRRDVPLAGTGDDSGSCLDFDLDFIVDYEVADVAFVLDTTGSMGGLAQALAAEFSAIAAELAGQIPDLTFGVATYQDYNYSSFGSGADLPFQLKQQQTDDLADVQSKLNSINASGGGDGPESTFEAIFQAATGWGYDQDCDGNYTAGDDVLPFVPSSSDAFGGYEAGVHDSSVSGTGEGGGMGFRDGVLPIIIVATDAELRDPENGWPSPQGCPDDAALSTTVDVLKELDAALIGVGVNTSTTSTAYTQFSQLTEEIGSLSDLDGDGSEEPAVVNWTGTSTDFRELITGAVEGMIGDEEVGSVWLSPADDTHNVVDNISPASYDDVSFGSEVSFTIDVDEPVYKEWAEGTTSLTFELIGEIGSTERVLDTTTVYVLLK